MIAELWQAGTPELAGARWRYHQWTNGCGIVGERALGLVSRLENTGECHDDVVRAVGNAERGWRGSNV